MNGGIAETPSCSDSNVELIIVKISLGLSETALESGEIVGTKHFFNYMYSLRLVQELYSVDIVESCKFPATSCKGHKP